MEYEVSIYFTQNETHMQVCNSVLISHVVLIPFQQVDKK